MQKTLYTALALAIAGCDMASAAMVHLPDTKLPIILAADGCGRGLFRTIDGQCIPNQPAGRRGRAIPPCPRGYLRDPDPARPICYPAF